MESISLLRHSQHKSSMLCILYKSSLRWNSLHDYTWWSSEFPLICCQVIPLSIIDYFYEISVFCFIVVNTKDFMLCILYKSFLRWNNLHVYIWWNSKFPLICCQMISLSRSFLRNLFPYSIAVSIKAPCFAFYTSHPWDETVSMTTFDETLSFLSPAVKWFHWVDHFYGIYFPALSQSAHKFHALHSIQVILEMK